MRLHHVAFTALLIAPVLVTAQENLGTYEDRIAVEDVMARYVWAVDSLDPGWLCCRVHRRRHHRFEWEHQQRTRGDSQDRHEPHSAARRQPGEGGADFDLYHVISNVRITFPKSGEALHQSYWQTVRRDKDGKMTAAAMGRSEDRLVKRNGKWLIQWRKLTVFTDDRW